MQALLIVGPAGVGKTSTARALQMLLPDPWLHFEVDICQPAFPQRQEFMTIDLDRRLQRANLDAARAYVDAGFRVLVEAGTDDEWSRASRAAAFADVDAPVVLLMCTRESLGHRLNERQQASQGWALRHYDPERWRQPAADRVIDTDQKSVDEVATELVAWLHDR